MQTRARQAGQVLQAKVAEVRHVPSQMERNSDQECLRRIRARHGSRAQTLINALLAFDAYFAWWFPLKRSIPFMAPWEQRWAARDREDREDHR